MEIILEHRTTMPEAIKKIDNFLDGLMKKDFPGGVKIKNPSKTWIQKNVMSFSFKVKKGLVGVTISGNISVDHESVQLLSKLPGMVTTFVNEDKIQEVIKKNFNELFPDQ